MAGTSHLSKNLSKIYLNFFLYSHNLRNNNSNNYISLNMIHCLAHPQHFKVVQDRKVPHPQHHQLRLKMTVMLPVILRPQLQPRRPQCLRLQIGRPLCKGPRPHNKWLQPQLLLAMDLLECMDGTSKIVNFAKPISRKKNDNNNTMTVTIIFKK